MLDPRHRRRNLLVAASLAAAVFPAGLPLAWATTQAATQPVANPICEPYAGTALSDPTIRPTFITLPPPSPTLPTPTSPSASPSASASPSVSPSPSASVSPSFGPTPSPTPSPTPCPTPSGSASPSPSVSPAPGCPPLGEPPDVYQRQPPILDAANDIDAVARGPVGPGYAGITIDVPECRIDVYWRGPLPPPVDEVVSRYDGPINVVVHEDAPYTRAELEPRADRLVDDPGLALAAGVELIRVGVPENGTGVTAGVLATSPLPDLLAAQAFLRRQLGVPVYLAFESPYDPMGRRDDGPPWFAGGRIRVEYEKDKFAACSVAWAVTVGEGEQKADYMMTAAHCGKDGERALNGDRSRTLGRFTEADRIKDRDSALLRVTSGSASMFTGRPNSATSVRMEKSVEVKVGAWICSSGASTGQNCDIKVDSIRERIRLEPGWWVWAATSTHKDDTGIAAGEGDSGGPVYIPVEKQTKIQAVGVLIAGHDKVDCRADDDTEACQRKMAFALLGDVLTRYEATLKTG